MRRVIAGVLAVGLVAAVLVGGSVLPGTGTGEAPGGAFDVLWISDTARDVGGNHHAPAAARVDGEGYVFAPVSGPHRSDTCALVALSAADGSAGWRYRVPAANCTIHSVGDPAVADADGDGDRELLAVTTERRVLSLDPVRGTVEASGELPAYGYAPPVVGDLVGGPAPEVVVADARGTVRVTDGNLSTVWSRSFDSFTYGQPAVRDFDADGAAELAVAPGQRGVVLLAGDGSTLWERPGPFESSITWTVAADIDADPAVEYVATTRRGRVVALDGRDGAVEWTRDVGDLAAVEAVGDGDGDGTPEVYAAASGAVHALSGPDGTVEWSRTLVEGEVTMTPPPALGDVTGDGRPDLVAPTNGGQVFLIDPRDGEVVGSLDRGGAVFTHPTLADTDGDGTPEAFLTYGDGRVVALSADAEE